MTAPNATQRSVQLHQVIEQIRARWKATKGPILRRHLSSLSKDLDKWGDCVIYENAELRHLVAESISHRLGLAPRYVKDRFDQIHRITCYDAEENSSGVAR